MARIQIEEVLDHLAPEIKKAFESTFKDHFPGATYDINMLFRSFRKNLTLRYKSWAEVPDRYVDKD